jgi:two-component system, response regulator / RNA-binding antiterminator
VDVIGPADLTQWRHDEEFREDPVPLLVLDRDLVIRAVNRAHERVTGFSDAMLVSCPVFEAYPANPAAPDGDDGRRSMEASFERVLREQRPHDLVLQRYDIRDAAEPGRFVRRTWLPVNAPVWAGGSVAGIVVRAEEVSLPSEAEQVLRRFRDLLRGSGEAGSDGEDDLHARVVDAVGWTLRSWSESLAQVRQLEEALASRSTIDQAKGILMARQRTDADGAFRELVRLSNESNVRLADVAKALVYQVGHDPAG